jgi:hypothetical protein
MTPKLSQFPMLERPVEFNTFLARAIEHFSGRGSDA